MTRPTFRITLGAAVLLLACGGEAPAVDGEAAAETGAAADPADAFLASIAGLCGQAFAGTITESVPPNPAFEGRRLVMHVRECSEDEIRIPFHVGEDRSRTWVLTRTAEGVRLKHDHRHEDGTEDEVTWYGGDASAGGSADRHEFPADSLTASIVPEAATNVWTVEVVPGERFVYALRREGTDRRFRVEFDLTAPVDPPPPPWGS